MPNAMRQRRNGHRHAVARLGARELARFAKNVGIDAWSSSTELSATRSQCLYHPLESSRRMMSQYRDLSVAFAGKPVELDNTAFAIKRLMAVPGILAAPEGDQGAGDWRNLYDNVAQ